MIRYTKRIGETPLQMLNRLREERPELKNERLSYAGRLDPVAEGEMIVMVGDENNVREKFLKRDKVYEVYMLFGFATDTYDILGLVEDYSDLNVNSREVKDGLKVMKKLKEIEYPAYSSKVVDGKPLFQWKREGRIREVEIPKRDIKVKGCKVLETEEISKQDLWNYIQFVIGEVKGDFRQQDIYIKWRKVLEDMEKESFQIAKVRFKVTSGTYIRSLTHMLGEEIGVPACILKLKRVKI